MSVPGTIKSCHHQRWDRESRGNFGGLSRGPEAEVPGERDSQDQPQTDGGRDYQEEVHGHLRHVEKREAYFWEPGKRTVYTDFPST